MLRRSLLVSAVLLVSSFGFANSAKAAPGPAEPATVEFSFSSGNTCTWGTPTDGILAVNTTDDGLETATDATININCNGAALLTVAAPVQVNGPETTTNNVATLSTVAFGNTTDTGTGIVVTGAGIDEDATVSMTADTAASPQAGTYEYTVLLTATPQ